MPTISVKIQKDWSPEAKLTASCLQTDVDNQHDRTAKKIAVVKKGGNWIGM
jgi:hypothetical protein